MSILLMNVSQIMEPMDEADWLDLATHGQRLELMTPKGGIASDGIRMHITKGASFVVGDEGSLRFYEYLERPDVRSAKKLFAIDREYLIEALAGLQSSGDSLSTIVFYASDAENGPIILSNQSCERVAVIMPMKVESELKLPSRGGIERGPDGFGTDEEKAKYKADVDFNKSLRGGTPSQRIG